MSRQNESNQSFLLALSRIVGSVNFDESIVPAVANADGVVEENQSITLKRARLNAAQYLQKAILDRASFARKFHNVVTAYRIFNLVNQFNAYVETHATTDQSQNRDKAAQATYAAILHLMEETVIRSGRAFGRFKSKLLDQVDIVPIRIPEQLKFPTGFNVASDATIVSQYKEQNAHRSSFLKLSNWIAQNPAYVSSIAVSVVLIAVGLVGGLFSFGILALPAIAALAASSIFIPALATGVITATVATILNRTAQQKIGNGTILELEEDSPVIPEPESRPALESEPAPELQSAPVPAGAAEEDRPESLATRMDSIRQLQAAPAPATIIAARAPAPAVEVVAEANHGDASVTHATQGPSIVASGVAVAADVAAAAPAIVETPAEAGHQVVDNDPADAAFAAMREAYRQLDEARTLSAARNNTRVFNTAASDALVTDNTNNYSSDTFESDDSANSQPSEAVVDSAAEARYFEEEFEAGEVSEDEGLVVGLSDEIIAPRVVLTASATAAVPESVPAPVISAFVSADAASELVLDVEMEEPDVEMEIVADEAIVAFEHDDQVQAEINHNPLPAAQQPPVNINQAVNPVVANLAIGAAAVVIPNPGVVFLDPNQEAAPVVERIELAADANDVAVAEPEAEDVVMAEVNAPSALFALDMEIDDLSVAGYVESVAQDNESMSAAGRSEMTVPGRTEIEDDTDFVHKEAQQPRPPLKFAESDDLASVNSVVSNEVAGAQDSTDDSEEAIPLAGSRGSSYSPAFAPEISTGDDSSNDDTPLPKATGALSFAQQAMNKAIAVSATNPLFGGPISAMAATPASTHVSEAALLPVLDSNPVSPRANAGAGEVSVLDGLDGRLSVRTPEEAEAIQSAAEAYMAEIEGQIAASIEELRERQAEETETRFVAESRDYFALKKALDKLGIQLPILVEWLRPPQSPLSTARASQLRSLVAIVEGCIAEIERALESPSGKRHFSSLISSVKDETMGVLTPAKITEVIPAGIAQIVQAKSLVDQAKRFLVRSTQKAATAGSVTAASSVARRLAFSAAGDIAHPESERCGRAKSTHAHSSSARAQSADAKRPPIILPNGVNHADIVASTSGVAAAAPAPVARAAANPSRVFMVRRRLGVASVASNMATELPVSSSIARAAEALSKRGVATVRTQAETIFRATTPAVVPAMAGAGTGRSDSSVRDVVAKRVYGLPTSNVAAINEAVTARKTRPALVETSARGRSSSVVGSGLFGRPAPAAIGRRSSISGTFVQARSKLAEADKMRDFCWRKGLMV